MIRWLLALLISCACAFANTNAIVVFAGHSIVFGTGASANSNFVSQLQSNLVGQYSAYLTNAGVSGAKIRDNYDQNTFRADLAAKAGYLKRTIYCLYGDNDLSDNTGLATVTNDFRIWVTNCRSNFPDAMIIGMTGQVIDWGGNSTISNRWVGLQAFIQNTNQSLFDAVVDVYSNPKFQNPFDTTYYNADKVHLSDRGYRELALMVMTNLLENRRLVMDWYVRKDGSDSNKGATNTAGGAFLTIAKSETMTGPADRVYVSTGLYAETVTHNNSGASNVVYVGTSATNGGFAVTQPNVSIHGFTANGTNMSTAHFEPSGSANNFTISNCTILGWGSASSSFKGVQNGFNPTATTNLMIDSCRFINTTWHALDLAGDSHTVTNCTFESTNGWDAIRIVASNSRFVGNLFTNWSNPGSWNANHTDIIQSLGDSGDTCTNVLFAENRIINCEDCQIGNFSDDFEAGAISWFTFRNNLYVNVYSTMNVYAPNFRFYHNTYYRCAALSGQVISFGDSGAGHGSNAVFLNNLFVECGTPTSAGSGWYYSSDAATTNGLLADYNLVVGTGAGTTKTTGASGWGRIGTETHGINGSDPLFVDAANLDFRLSTGSPARNAATNSASFAPTDINGNLRGALPDMGAFEGDGGEQEPSGPAAPAAAPRLRFKFRLK